MKYQRFLSDRAYNNEQENQSKLTEVESTGSPLKISVVLHQEVGSNTHHHNFEDYTTKSIRVARSKEFLDKVFNENTVSVTSSVIKHNYHTDSKASLQEDSELSNSTSSKPILLGETLIYYSTQFSQSFAHLVRL